ncbi:Dynein assembly factor with WDR repeat domains 1 [Clydaea vesicula]|uniref:Dynein assembly factor with WDR repeat domains 1 n=1 Tax=Clydaea vesicula TaxID=447962 RepID=A0AAD5U7B8_9FUNG|nr:Dynein assembly factor with WDR repeat domains 1 [Clydaea vesicula]
MESKDINLFDLDEKTDVFDLTNKILLENSNLLKKKRFELICQLLTRLKEKISKINYEKFVLTKKIQAHSMPLTNCCLNKSGSRLITSSYDRTCKLFDTKTGELLHKYEGHQNVVSCLSFNNPFGDKIVTGSFDKTLKLWSTETGKLYHTFNGHHGEIICASFNGIQSNMLGSGSMDGQAILWDIRSGNDIWRLRGHSEEIVNLSFNNAGNIIATGSFDHTINLWDVRTGRTLHTLIGHRAEVTSVLFNFDSSLLLTGSMDGTAKIWDTSSGKCLSTLRDHTQEILDVTFSPSGNLIATCSSDSTCKIYTTKNNNFELKFNLKNERINNENTEISKVMFNGNENFLLTSSKSNIVKIWNCSDDFKNNTVPATIFQTLQDHEDEVFYSCFNYYGAKDNTCNIYNINSDNK